MRRACMQIHGLVNYIQLYYHVRLMHLTASMHCHFTMATEPFCKALPDQQRQSRFQEMPTHDADTSSKQA